jgi:hemerythrin-like domain-containing protein
MNGSRILDRLRADHQRVLGDLEVLERAAGAIAAGRRRRALEETTLRRLLSSVADQFDTHMAAEDEVLFPALARALPDSLGGLESFRADHLELRGMLAALETLVGRPAAPARDEQIAIQSRDFVDLLRIHIRKEEAVVFAMAEHVLPAAAFAHIAQRMSRGRSKGPRA